MFYNNFLRMLSSYKNRRNVFASRTKTKTELHMHSEENWLDYLVSEREWLQPSILLYPKIHSTIANHERNTGGISISRIEQ